MTEKQITEKYLQGLNNPELYQKIIEFDNRIDNETYPALLVKIALEKQKFLEDMKASETESSAEVDEWLQKELSDI